MEDLRSGIERLKQAKAHMREANGIMSDCISELKEIEEENVELKAEIAIIQPEDVDGAAIHVGDAVYFESEVAKVCGMRWDGASWSLSLHDRAEDTASSRCRRVSILASAQTMRHATTVRMVQGRLATHAGRTPAATCSPAPRSSRASKRRSSDE